MKIGTLLRLEINDPKTATIKRYRCKVIEQNTHYLFVDYPIDEKTNKTVFLPKNQVLTVTFVSTNQSVYSFRSKIISKVKVNIPALALQIPEKQSIKRIQRREYVRIDTAIDVTVHSTDGLFPPFQSVTNDVSGGGLSIVLPHTVLLIQGDELDIWFVLPMQSGDYHYIYAQAEVVRVQSAENTVSAMSIKFTSISKDFQQQIMHFCFEKQREARKKELI
ncbi:flagellar brake domain-containing protein [Lentibacillus sp. N15]|uniref:flagellar brake protein n=1 Tax=Lentibacillus songyuanensis TaxID=3136161 RepID=UPI0031B9CB2F